MAGTGSSTTRITRPSRPARLTRSGVGTLGGSRVPSGMSAPPSSGRARTSSVAPSPGARAVMDRACAPGRTWNGGETTVVSRRRESATPPVGRGVRVGGSRPNAVHPARPARKSPFGGPGSGGPGAAWRFAFGGPVTAGRAGGGTAAAGVDPTAAPTASAESSRERYVRTGSPGPGRVRRHDRGGPHGRLSRPGRRRRGRDVHRRGGRPRGTGGDGEGAEHAGRPERRRRGGGAGRAGAGRARARGGRVVRPRHDRGDQRAARGHRR